jgi:transposase-like protein
MGKHTAKEYFDEQGRLIIRPYYIKDLASIYGINRKTMCKWIGRFPKQLSQKDGKHFSIRQVTFILKKYGMPSHGMAA